MVTKLSYYSRDNGPRIGGRRFRTYLTVSIILTVCLVVVSECEHVVSRYVRGEYVIVSEPFAGLVACVFAALVFRDTPTPSRRTWAWVWAAMCVLSTCYSVFLKVRYTE